MTGLGALVLAVVAQAAIIGATIDHLQALAEADDEARTELLHYAAMYEAVLNEEAGLRGFVSSHDPAFLQTYENGRRRFEAGLPRLRQLAAEDPLPMRQRVEDIARQEASWTRTVASPQIEAIQVSGRGLAGARAGRAEMDAIRSDFTILRGGEMHRLEQRDWLRRHSFGTSRLTLLLGSGSALLFAMWLAVRSLRRLVAQQRAAHAAAAKLSEALERAHASERAKTTFLSNMSHEMRTPLNGVAGMAEALVRTDLNPRQREMAAVIRMSAATLDGLIGNLLALACGDEVHETPRQGGSLHLGDEVRAIAAEHRAPAEIKGLRLDVAVAPEAEVRVVADAAELEQLLTCLLSNAVKFTDRGHVRLTLTSPAEHRYRFEVADTGVGFDEARKAELFDTFTQSDDSATRRHGGAGVGLALARRLATHLGGHVDCHSILGEGSTFTFDVDLPLAAERLNDPTGLGSGPVAMAAEPADEAPLRVLVVDDNPINRKVLELILGSLGVECVSVEDGRQAVEAAGRQAFAAILMDIQMPVMDGLTATREIRRLEQAAGRRATPVIIVSANGEPEYVHAGRAAGAQLHLTKPVAAEGLVDALNTVLANPASTGEAAAA